MRSHTRDKSGPDAGTNEQSHLVTINGVTYESSRGGTKLIRVADGQASVVPESPRSATINGVSYVRSKSGNLLMKKAITPQQKVDKQCPHFLRTGMCYGSSTLQTNKFSGICKKGLSCPYNHNPEKVVLCKHYLQGKCTHNDCTLSHKASPYNSPLCKHYLRGQCKASPCPYTHKTVEPNAKICRDFALQGCCEKGLECNERHVFECPDFEETGSCPRPNCKLSHMHKLSHDIEPGKSSQSNEVDYDAITKSLETTTDGDVDESDNQDGSDHSSDYDSDVLIEVDPDSTINDDFISI